MTTAETGTRETQALIVGGGPTGQCASIALSRFGVSSLLVEKHPSTSPFPRTRSVHRKAMEIFRRWGLEGSIHARDLDLEPVMLWAESLTGPVLRRQDYVPRSNPDLSPCRVSNIFQQDLERCFLTEPAARSWPTSASRPSSARWRSLAMGWKRRSRVVPMARKAGSVLAT